MAKSANLPADIEEVAESLGSDDELLTPDEALLISLFSPPQIAKPPNFRKLPENSVWLRRAEPGRAMCTQGAAGATAFFILTTEDILRLRESQLESIQKVREANDTKQDAMVIHKHFAALSNRQLRRRESKIQAEADELQQRLEESRQTDLPPRDESTDYSHPTQVATANLLVNRRTRRGLFRRITQTLFGRGRSKRKPDYIPIDGPADINARTMKGPLHQGDLFGEMSCMNRAPRSATVLVERECYLVEMIRNVLDFLHKDKVYKERMDDIYRHRVLEAHIRNLSIFQDLTDEQFARLRDSIELVEYQSGSIIFEEHEPSDCFYVIRSGLVKVVANAWCLLREKEFDDRNWKSLCGELQLCSQDSSEIGNLIWSSISTPAQDIIREHANAATLDNECQRVLLDALNDVIQLKSLPKSFGKMTEEVVGKVGSQQLSAGVTNFPDRWDAWSDLEFRFYFRLSLEHLCPNGIPRRTVTAGVRHTLAYLGRGDCFGEIGVIEGGVDERKPRTATCYAYDHPDGGADMRIPDSRTGSVPSRVELVRIDKRIFHELLGSSNRVRRHVEDIAKSRMARSTREHQKSASQIASLAQHSPEFEQLGLIQGQELMLIDLDRCTRCNACVDACVSSHDDGRSRLYLDGPRFENYLVPLTCRKCLDPVCMIGCPVGAINRGSKGEIEIEDWCIGCRMCADQCPYGSIQMSEFPLPKKLAGTANTLLPDASSLNAMTERAVVCDLCSSLHGSQPSCVYACPHDAALRVDARDFFLERAE